MKVYIAGPMRGHDQYNFPAFDAVAEELRDEGCEVVNPADLDRAAGFDPSDLPDDWDWNELPDGVDSSEYADRDLDALATCDAIYMLPGWRQSTGATAEYAVAKWRGLMLIGHVEDDTAAKRKALLPSDSQRRKDIPLYSGLFMYFPRACAEVARLSKAANEKHNPGEPMRWSREKSSDHHDCAARHLMEAGVLDDDGFLHEAHLAWRSLAILELSLEKRDE